MNFVVDIKAQQAHKHMHLLELEGVIEDKRVKTAVKTEQLKNKKNKLK